MNISSSAIVGNSSSIARLPSLSNGRHFGLPMMIRLSGADSTVIAITSIQVRTHEAVSFVANGRRTEKPANAEMPLSPQVATGAGSRQLP